MRFVVTVHAGPDDLQVDGAGRANLAELCSLEEALARLAENGPPAIR